MSQQPSRVIYLPPGVVPPVPAGVVPTSGIPFDRTFFEGILPQAISSFCQQANCKAPVVELLTVDGSTHYVNGIAGVADQWVALQTSLPDHPHPIQIFVPFQTIFRVEIHPEGDERRAHLGFVTSSVQGLPMVEPGETPTGRRAARKPAASKAK